MLAIAVATERSESDWNSLREWKELLTLIAGIFSLFLHWNGAVSWNCLKISFSSKKEFPCSSNPINSLLQLCQALLLANKSLGRFAVLGTFTPTQLSQGVLRMNHGRLKESGPGNQRAVMINFFSHQGLNMLNKAISQTHNRLIRCQCCTLQCGVT